MNVNAIAAGIFDTELAQALPDRLLQMHDFGLRQDDWDGRRNWPSTRAFMVSDRNSFMNGEVVIVDGGAVT